jgi:hypothetical protein
MQKLYAMVTAVTLTALAGPASAASLTFNDVTFPGTGVPLSVTGSNGNAFTFSAGPSSQFEAFKSGGIGSFPAGTYFLAPGLGNNTPIDVSFSSPVSSISIPVSSDRTGNSPYTSTVKFFDGASLIDTITLSGNTLNPPEVFTFDGVTTSVDISTSANSPFGYTQNIGPIAYDLTTTPLPAALPLFAGGLGALGLFGWRKRKAVA